MIKQVLRFIFDKNIVITIVCLVGAYYIVQISIGSICYLGKKIFSFLSKVF